MFAQGGFKETNLSHAEELIKEASESGAQIALFPECLDLGRTNPSSQFDAEPISEGTEVFQGPYGVDGEAILYADIVPKERPFRGHDWSKMES